MCGSPADPGTYAFSLRPGIRYDYRDSGLGLEQETGGHAIIRTYPSSPSERIQRSVQAHALDVSGPPLPDGAANVEPSEHILGQGLRVTQVSEPDIDEDGLGDRSQDRGDLRILSATVGLAEDDQDLAGANGSCGGAGAHPQRRNTTRQLPHIVVPKDSLGGAGCVLTVTDPFCSAPPLKPGRETLAQRVIYTIPHDLPARLSVTAEGMDLHPQDNTMPLRCAKTCGGHVASVRDRAAFA